MGSRKNLYAFVILFVLSLVSVFRIVDYKIVFVIVLAAVFVIDKKLFRKVDYSLLATFVFFFVFTGNIGNIEPVKNYLSMLINGREMLFSVLLSQVLSNVPTAVLLSNFTSDVKSLVVGTNIGGLGTLVASLASLISYKLYVQTEGAKPLKYLGVFTLINSVMLVILFIFSSMIIS
jgi:hypothetical protein